MSPVSPTLSKQENVLNSTCTEGLLKQLQAATMRKSTAAAPPPHHAQGVEQMGLDRIKHTILLDAKKIGHIRQHRQLQHVGDYDEILIINRTLSLAVLQDRLFPHAGARGRVLETAAPPLRERPVLPVRSVLSFPRALATIKRKLDFLEQVPHLCCKLDQPGFGTEFLDEWEPGSSITHSRGHE